MPRKKSNKPKIKVLKSKIKIIEPKAEDEEEFEYEEEFVPQQKGPAFVPSAIPRKLTSVLKSKQRNLESSLPEESPTTKSEGPREEVKYERASAGSKETRISYESAKAGDINKYTGRDKYQTVESMSPEERMAAEAKERRERTSYSETNPFSAQRDYAEQGFHEPHKENGKEKDQRRRQMF